MSSDVSCDGNLIDVVCLVLGVLCLLNFYDKVGIYYFPFEKKPTYFRLILYCIIIILTSLHNKLLLKIQLNLLKRAHNLIIKFNIFLNKNFPELLDDIIIFILFLNLTNIKFPHLLTPSLNHIPETDREANDFIIVFYYYWFKVY